MPVRKHTFEDVDDLLRQAHEMAQAMRSDGAWDKTRDEGLSKIQCAIDDGRAEIRTQVVYRDCRPYPFQVRDRRT
jgi:hypothetical protein